MKIFFPGIFIFMTYVTQAQIGIGTTSPASMLDVRGSLSLNFRSFSTNTTAGFSDNTLSFNGASAATVSLPDAALCTGRIYTIKNVSNTSPTPLLTVLPSSAESIEGKTSWVLDEKNELVTLVSNGANWDVTSGTTDDIRNNYVLVKSIADFPAPVNGVITLNSTTLYEINGTITLTSKIDINGASITGADAVNDKLIYMPSSGELFTGNNGGNIKLLTLTAATAGSKLFNLDAINAGKNLIIQNCYIAGCNNIGLIKGFGGTVYINTVIYVHNSNGITFENIKNVFTISALWDSTNHNTYEKFTGAFNIIQKLVGASYVKSGNSAVALDVSGITTINAGGSLKTTLFTGDGVFVVGTFSNKWEVETYGLNTEKDDVATGSLYISASAATTFTAVNVPTKVLGTTVSSGLFRTSAAGNNRLSYTGTKTKRFLVICSVSLTASANNKVFSLYIAKNGIVANESKQSRKLATGADQGAMAISCIIELATNDYIELWVENNTDATSMTVLTLNMAIK